MQVAETFAMDEDELRQMQPTDSEEYILEQLKPLAGIAKLDTCVTILDATQVFTYFDAAEYLAQRFKEADTMDERTVSDLLCDQIEFADVIMINKIDLATPEMVKRCEDLVRTLNPRAIVHKTRHSKIDMKHILNTGRFDFAQAAMSPGWLQSLKEPIVPETQEYGIGSFVYRARKPFHPDRLFQLLNQYFILLETGGDVPEDGEEGDGEEDCGDVEEGDEDGDAEEGEDDEDTGIDQEVATERLQKKQTSPFRGLLRSKGFVWLATRNDMMGEWSQAGLVLTMSSGGPWFASLPEEDWPEEKVIRDEIMKDYDENTGDRRQELVFIGQVTNEEAEALIKLLDGCLVTDHEWTQYQNGEMDSWEDPWEPWVDAGRDEEEEDEDMGDL
jgi:G3E family GTPase